MLSTVQTLSKGIISTRAYTVVFRVSSFSVLRHWVVSISRSMYYLLNLPTNYLATLHSKLI
nr:MAG TPA: hypothetical protein [Caudoviricetes sp.]